MYTGENWVIYQKLYYTTNEMRSTNDKLLPIVVELGENVLCEKNAKHTKEQHAM